MCGYDDQFFNVLQCLKQLTLATRYVRIQDKLIVQYFVIKTHGHVLAAKEDVWHTSVLFTGTAKSPFSTPQISITTGLISIKFTYFMPFIYITLHTKFKENQCSSLRDTCF